MREVNGKFYVTVRFDDADSAREFERGVKRHDGGDVLNALADGDAEIDSTPVSVQNTNVGNVGGTLMQTGIIGSRFDENPRHFEH